MDPAEERAFILSEMANKHRADIEAMGGKMTKEMVTPPGCSEEDQRSIDQMFEKFDVNKNGVIEGEECFAACQDEWFNKNIKYFHEDSHAFAYGFKE